MGFFKAVVCSPKSLPLNAKYQYFATRRRKKGCPQGCVSPGAFPQHQRRVPPSSSQNKLRKLPQDRKSIKTKPAALPNPKPGSDSLQQLPKTKLSSTEAPIHHPTRMGRHRSQCHAACQAGDAGKAPGHRGALWIRSGPFWSSWKAKGAIKLRQIVPEAADLPPAPDPTCSVPESSFSAG